MRGPQEAFADRMIGAAIRPTVMSRLQAITDALGVSIDAFREPAEPYILHTAMDGTRWLLARNAQGVPVVRVVDSPRLEQRSVEENVSAFLTRDPGSPQQRALAALIDRLLAGHLAG